jgi:hypothetical protein
VPQGVSAAARSSQELRHNVIFSQRSAAMATIAVVALPLVFPGDAPWINDEPRLIAEALRLNRDGHLASVGLTGTASVGYGPLPIWIYQLLLSVSHDPVVLTVWHAALFMAATALALWWLARSTGLPPLFIPIVLLSPYVWFYSRLLWDNTFCIPLGACAVAGYASWLERDSRIGVAAAIAASIGLLLTHLMAAALVLPLAIHALAFRGRAVWRHRSVAFTAVALGAAVAWQYGRYLTSLTPAPFAGVSWAGVVFPLTGGRLLTAHGLAYFFGATALDAGVLSFLVTAADWISSVGYALVWIGLAIAANRVARERDAGLKSCATMPRPDTGLKSCATMTRLTSGATATRLKSSATQNALAGIAIAAVVVQMAIDGISGKVFHPHYHSGTWIAFAVLAWFATDALVHRPWGLVVPIAHGVSLAAVVVFLIARLHATGGTRELYGPTLANQVDVARRLSQYDSAAPISIEVVHYQRYPHALASLRALTTHTGGSNRPLAIRYASADARDGTIELVPRDR